MYTFLKNFKLREGLLADLPALGISIVLAEFFYKFHSFTLECIGFLATWTALSFVFAQLANLIPRRALTR